MISSTLCLLLLCSAISSARAGDSVDVVTYSFPSIRDSDPMIITNTTVITSPVLPLVSSYSSSYESDGFVLLGSTVELWRSSSTGEHTYTSTTLLQANFSTSFIVVGSDPVAFIVLKTNVPLLLNSRYGLRGPPIDLNATVTPAHGNSIAAVEIGSVNSYSPESGLNVTVTPANSSSSSLTVWIDYDYVHSYVGVYVARADGIKPKDQVANSSTVDLTLLTSPTAYVGFYTARVDDVLNGGILNWNLKVDRLPAADDGRKHKWLVILLAVLGAVAAVACTAAAVAVYLKSKYRKWNKDLEQLAKSMSRLPGMPCRIGFAEIKKATNNFDSKMELGSGAFGSVYRCRLPAAATHGVVVDVAVKKFTRNDNRRYDDFLDEVSVINRLRHRNVVPLVGWSYHGGVPLLVFELMPNGSLDQHLFRLGAPILQWGTRYGIARDIATGLHYVHHEYEPAVLHRDIKASNVLLDSTFCARLGDFGIACTVALDRNSVTGLAGTRGYIAPEYPCSYKATRETDIYAFGVVVLETVTGKRALSWDVQSDGPMIDFVWRLHGEGRLLDAVDPVLHTVAGLDADEARRLLLLGLACTNPNPSERPSMTEAMQVITKLAPPPDVPLEKPTFVWPPHGWHPRSSYCTTEMSNLGRSSLSTVPEEVNVSVEDATSGTNMATQYSHPRMSRAD